MTFFPFINFFIDVLADIISNFYSSGFNYKNLFFKAKIKLNRIKQYTDYIEKEGEIQIDTNIYKVKNWKSIIFNRFLTKSIQSEIESVLELLYESPNLQFD